MLASIPRKQLDEILFGALQAIYRFERVKVARFGLTYEQIYLLQFLRRHGPLAMSDIAAEMKIPLSTATRLIDRMERRRLLSRRQSRGDKRSRIVSIAANGEHLVRTVEEHTFSVLMANLEGRTDIDVDAIVRTAMQLKEILHIENVQAKKET